MPSIEGNRRKEKVKTVSLSFADGSPFFVSKKSAKIAALIERHRGQHLSPYYLGYFELFNAQLFYESHDVLEELWLANRQGANGDFYKGLIQLAGAFVHLQKHTEERPRLRPSAALFKLAQKNLEKYPAVCEQLDLGNLLRLIQVWLARLEAVGYEKNPLTNGNVPQIFLIRQG
ncbi:MAG: DUF309 domain-containing protein [Verrucomicrobiota bacterium]